MSQESDILSHLKRRGSITPIEALNKYGCFRLAARILDLRCKGYPIETITVAKGDKTFAKYELLEI